MRTKILLYTLLATFMISCANEGMPDESRLPIRLSVVANGTVESRAHLYKGTDGIVEEKEFALNAYLINNQNTPYLTKTWVQYVEDVWRFGDKAHVGRLLDYYWPNDHKVNFVAYMPYDMDKSVVEQISFANDGGINFDCSLPGTTEDESRNRTVNDTDDEERSAEDSYHEFVYAYRHEAPKGSPVNLRFVHPFAAIKFKLSQSHRDLKIHSITLSGVRNTGTYTNANDTYTEYGTNQSGLTYESWSGGTPGNFILNYDKTVPEDINYYSPIGGPYLVIPQDLTDITLSVKYTWGGNVNNTKPVSIIKEEITIWQPGKVYIYTLDLGDNKEEMLFQATVEEWVKGEDEDYEHEFEL